MRSSSSSRRRRLLALRLRPRVLLLALQLDPVAVGEQLHRLGEAEPLLLLDELDHVAADPAAEAVVELLLRLDRERRRALLVERAEADPAGALAAQVGVGGDHLDDVGRLLDPFEALGGDQRHQKRASSGIVSSVNLAMQKRSVIPAM